MNKNYSKQSSINNLFELSCNECILMSGYLYKKGRLNRLLKRWIVIRGNYLYSYKSKSAHISGSYPTQIINLSLCNDIISNRNATHFELVFSGGQRKKYITQSANDMNAWIDTISPLLITPTTHVHNVFRRIYKSLGMGIDNWLNDSTQQLTQLWYYRAVDLLNIDNDLWNTLRIHPVIQKNLFNYIQIWRKQKQFIQFKEPIYTTKCNTKVYYRKQKNIKYILDNLLFENRSQSTTKDIKCLESTLRRNYLFNIDKIKMYFTKSDWDSIKIQKYLKTIVLNKIYECNLIFDEKKEGNVCLDNFSPSLTLQQLSERNSLFMMPDCVMKYLKPFMKYKYNRLYHLSTINDELYNKLMCNAPKGLRLELYAIIKQCRKQMNGKSLPFSPDALSASMKVKELFTLLENDLNVKKNDLLPDYQILQRKLGNDCDVRDLFSMPKSMWKLLTLYNKYEIIQIRMADLINDLRNQVDIKHFALSGKRPMLCIKDVTDTTVTVNTRNIYDNKYEPLRCRIKVIDQSVISESEWMTLDKSDSYICTNLIANHSYQIRAKYANNFGIRCHTEITSFITLPTAPIFELNQLNITDSSVTVQLQSNSNLECHIEISELKQNNLNWKRCIVKKSKSFPFRLISDLKCDENYQIKMRYKNKSCFSYYSNTLTFKTNPPNPPIFSIADITSDCATLKFSEPTHSDALCRIEIMEIDSCQQWTYVGICENVKIFICDDLKRNCVYKIRAQYPKYAIFSQEITFETTDWSDIVTKTEETELKERINEYTNNEYKTQWKLLYQAASKDGFSSQAFNDKCYMKQNTVCIIKTAHNDVIASFSTNCWSKSKLNSNEMENNTYTKSFIHLLRSHKGLKHNFGRLDTLCEQYNIYLSDNCHLNGLSNVFLSYLDKHEYFKVKEIEIYQLYEKIRTHNIGYGYEWCLKPITNWTTDHVLHWISCVDSNYMRDEYDENLSGLCVMSDEYYYKIVSIIKDCKCNGLDLIELQSPTDIGHAFDIIENQILCQHLFTKLKHITGFDNGNNGNNNSSYDSTSSVCSEENTFTINIFSQQRHIVLNEKVTKTTKISYIKQLYKQQTGVKAAIHDINFYCRSQQMHDNQMLEELNIYDERHLISVKFSASGGRNNE